LNSLPPPTNILEFNCIYVNYTLGLTQICKSSKGVPVSSHSFIPSSVISLLHAVSFMEVGTAVLPHKYTESGENLLAVNLASVVCFSWLYTCSDIVHTIFHTP
jgi:hypothetical protein